MKTIYQVALLQSLAQGYFDGVISIGELKSHGDTGIGTFDRLNGELIILNGKAYKALADGSIVIAPDDETVPFSNVTFFKEDYSLTLSGISDMAALRKKLNAFVNENGSNFFYMVKIAGTFASIKVRSEPTFVTYSSRKSTFLKQFCQIVEHLSSHSDSLLQT